MPRDAFVLIKQRELCHPKCARKVSGLSRNGPLARLGNIVADANVSQFSRARAGNMCCGNKFCCSEVKMFLPGVKNIFASRTQILRPKHMFPSLPNPVAQVRIFKCMTFSLPAPSSYFLNSLLTHGTLPNV